MNRHRIPVAMLVLAACAAPARTTATQEIGTNGSAAATLADASPSEVYLQLATRRSALQAELKPRFNRLDALQAEGREQERQQQKKAIYESVDPTSLEAFFSRASIREREALSPAERGMMFAMYLSPDLTPARVEVANEAVAGDQATLEVRGWFDELVTGKPGWIAGTVTLVREADGWKVDSESFVDPGSSEDDPPSGSFEVGGGLPTRDEEPVVTQSMDESFGGGWSFAIRDKGYVVRFNNIPHNAYAGDYVLTLRPGIPGDADPDALQFPVSVSFSSTDESGDTDRTWDESLTGTLTIDSVAGDVASGHFVFTAEPFTGEPVTVRGTFRNVPILK